MREPIADQDRDQVRRLHADGLSRNAIAAQIGRSSSTVSKIAAELGLAFVGGARVASATVARQEDLAALRRDLTARLYRRAAANLDRVEADTYVRVELLPTGETAEVVSDDPPAQDERHHSQAIGGYLTSAARLAEIDAGTSGHEVRSMLTDLARGLRAAFADEDEAAADGG
ncbi:Helix-turn-helix domain-containing protein [Streptomyces sp. TLI_053]|uniref:helix-turn-helix domain-containing protein n=1 Tax=Streptomyces sp. TLI_053 TaxID=1855352 RepID=UPI00087C983B|nr:helix-turn-helix domain-containing protein [Streptomyces sp. TLI_053]SDT69676.1 Helix-turn-helix domain-containing protein [Streptomyces sp. TLI_053]